MYTGKTYASHTANTITITCVRFANKLYVEPAAWELKSALLFIEIRLFCNWGKKITGLGKVASNFILISLVSLNILVYRILNTSTTYLSCTYVYKSTTVRVCIVSVLRKTNISYFYENIEQTNEHRILKLIHIQHLSILILTNQMRNIRTNIFRSNSYTQVLTVGKSITFAILIINCLELSIN